MQPTTEVPAVHAFEDALPGVDDPAQLLGGKAAGLATMVRELGLPVPPGFVVTTRVCHEFLASGWPGELDGLIAKHLECLADSTGRRFGDANRPLLVSVRSGAPVSMPGMMDTLLNVGMTPAIRERLAEESDSPVFAADTWLRFNRMYAEIVLELPRDELQEASVNDGTAHSILAAAARIRALAGRAGGVPDEPFAQLTGAIRAVFRSWNSERSIVFRKKEGIAADLGTAATVQAMAFGNLDDQSGTGVAFTRDPATGAPIPCGDYLARAQGEDVVAGSHQVMGLDALAAQLPAVHHELLDVLARLEHHYRDMCDVEFTVSSGRLYLLQTRVGRRSPLAAVRIAVSMAEDQGFPLSRAEAVARISDETLRELARLGRVSGTTTPFASGLAVSPGVACGALCCDSDRAAEWADEGRLVILARPETSPADVHGMVASAGLVTTLGGMVSHAAVVARGWAIPAICSLAGATVERHGIRTGGEFVAEGETVTIDGTTGHLYRGDCREDATLDLPEVRKLRAWALEAVAPTTAPLPEPASELTPFELLRALQLKGLCSIERLAAVLGCPEEIVSGLLEQHESFLKQTPRGFALTAEGRDWVQQQLAQECSNVRASLEVTWGQFLPLNQQLKAIVSEAQMSGMNREHELWGWLVDSMQTLHSSFRPVVEGVAEAVPRLRGYPRRFDSALAALASGDQSMLASPLKDSYHTVWFEFHEELIALTGRNREEEERQHG